MNNQNASLDLQPPAQAPKPRAKRGGRGLALGCLVLLVLGLGALIGARIMGTQAAVAMLNDKVGRADRWQVGLGLLDLPKAALGLPFNAKVSADGLQLPDAQVRRLVVDAEGARVDRAAGRLLGAQRVGVEAEFGEQTVVKFIRDEALSTKVLQDISIQFGVDELLLNGIISAPMLQRYTDFSRLAVSAKGKPEIVPPATIAVRVNDVSLRSGDQRVNIPTTLISGLIAQDLRFNLNDVLPGLTLQEISVVEQGLAIRGTLDPAALSGGIVSTPRQPLPGPSPGPSVQS
ncbi:MAG TPA: hypothetical protein DCZ72_07480 [Armatimonadetes bacterium]|nr:hypothetical protein [Armatimonadota bacterium]